MVIRSFYLATAIAVLTAAWADAQEYSIDAGSPEVPGVSPADILEIQGGNVVVKRADLLLPVDAEIDAFSYGVDQLDPLGPNFYVSVYYSVDRAAVGDDFDARPGGGAVKFQAQNGNGAAGDTFFAKIIWAGPLVAPAAVGASGISFAAGMFPISRGLWMDATTRPLTPLPEPQSDIDGLSIFHADLAKPIYLSLPAGNSLGFSGADILYYRPADPPTRPQPTLELWASAAALGLAPETEIDGLAIKNPGADKFTRGDIVYVSLNPPGIDPVTRRTVAVWQVSPGPVTPVFLNDVLTLEEGDNLNAVTGFDPGFGIWPPYWDPKGEVEWLENLEAERNIGVKR